MRKSLKMSGFVVAKECLKAYSCSFPLSSILFILLFALSTRE